MLSCKNTCFFITCILTLFLTGAIVSGDTDPNLIGWWTFDDGAGTVATDSAGSRNGTIINGGVWTTGKVGGAFNFSGTASCTVPVAAMASVSKEVTVSFWAKGNSDMPVYGMAFKANGTNSRIEASLPTNLYGSWYTIFVAGQANSEQASIVLGAGTYKDSWHHFAYTKSSATGNIKIYIDGALAATAVGKVTLLNTDITQFSIGSGAAGALPYHGSIDDFRLYNRALTANEISRLAFPDTVCQAWNPWPANAASNSSTTPILTWSSGDGADSHNVYFGTNYNTVNNAEHPAGDIDPNGLVDFVDLLILSEQWLSNPDGEEFSADLNTDSIVNFLDFRLLANTWGTAGVNPDAFQGSYTTNNFAPGTLQTGQTYYWRVDEIDGGNVCRGPVWSFKIEGLYIERLEMAGINLRLGADGGNNWACHQTKIVRTTGGDLFTAYTVPTTHSATDGKEWRMSKRNANGTWTELPYWGDSGRDPVFLLFSPATGNLYITAWAYMSAYSEYRPVIWSYNPTTNVLTGPSSVWNPPASNSTSYHAAGINSNGNIVVLVSQGEGTLTKFCWSKSNPAATSWTYHTTDFSTQKRHCYHYIFPAANSGSAGGLTWVNIRDISWTQAGLQLPTYGSIGGMEYCFNVNAMWRTDGVGTNSIATYNKIAEAGQSTTYPYLDAYAFVFDSYEDTSGRIHVLYRFVQYGSDQMRHAVRDSAGNYLADVELPAGVLGNVGAVHIFQDSTGRFYLLGTDRIWQATDTDTNGTDWGTVKILNYGNNTPQNMFVAVPRCGTSLQDYIDGAYLSTTADGVWHYFRIRLK